MPTSASKALGALAAALDTLRPYKRLLVAFSGGCDSTCLLHAAGQVESFAPVVALHVNHGLSANADAWQKHCEQMARTLNVGLITEVVKVHDRGRGLEDAAREARYSAFANHLEEGDLLLTAHHADDQAETVLLRLFRGTGPAGLVAIRPVRSFRSARLVRPWLGLTRCELESYAREFDLPWVEDESNSEPSFDRNYIRLELMPRITRRWPAAKASMARAAALLAEQQTLLDDYAREDLEALEARPERFGHSIALAPLHAWSDARAAGVMRYWLARNHLNPTSAQLHQLLLQSRAAEDRQPLLVLGGQSVRRFRDRLYCVPAPLTDSSPTLLWDTSDAGLRLPDGSELSATGHADGGLKPGRYRVTFRGRGERCHPVSREHSQTLKKLLQEYRLEPWLRSRVPLLYDGDQLAAVGDLWVEKHYFTPQQGILLRWRYPSSDPS